MGDDKVKESPSEVFATVADVNSAIHSQEEVFGVRFQAVEEKLAATDIANERRFASLEKKIAALDARVEGRFGLLEEKINAQDLKVTQSVTSAANKLLIMMLVIAGSIIASLLYVG